MHTLASTYSKLYNFFSLLEICQVNMSICQVEICHTNFQSHDILFLSFPVVQFAIENKRDQGASFKVVVSSSDKFYWYYLDFKIYMYRYMYIR